MDRHARLMRTLDFVVERGSVKVEDIVKALDVSPATVRRDLETLDSQLLLTRTRGGAVANPSSGEVSLRYRRAGMAGIKEDIARSAARLVAPGDVIGLNGGTTTTDIAREIALRVGSDPTFDDAPVTIVTNAVNIAYEMVVRDNLQVVVLGGTVRPKSYELVGAFSDLVLPALSIKHLFLGIVALDIHEGVYNNDPAEAKVNRGLVDNAEEVTVVADHTKIGKRAFAKICDLDAIDRIVTDDRLPEEDAAALRDTGVDLIRA